MIIVGVSGVSGSGKSRLSKGILQHFAENITLIPQDNYYFPVNSLPKEQRALQNYDIPSAIDFLRLKKDLLALKTNGVANIPQYDFVEHDRREETVAVQASPIILVEGTMVLTQKELLPLWDGMIYVDTPLDISTARRFVRDIAERGRHAEGILAQYLSTTREGMLAHTIPGKEYAELVVSGAQDVLLHLPKVLEYIAGLQIAEEV